LGEPANRYSNSRATHVNPIVNIFPGPAAGFFGATESLPNVESVSAIGADEAAEFSGCAEKFYCFSEIRVPNSLLDSLFSKLSNPQ